MKFALKNACNICFLMLKYLGNDFGYSSVGYIPRPSRIFRFIFGGKSMNIVDIVEKEGMRTDLPKLSIGDTVRVNVKIKEGEKERIQAFEGVIIAFKNGSIRETFTVRRVSFGIGVERTFPLHSPKIDSIKIVRHGRVRRAKLYYLRNKFGKAARLREIVR